MSHKPTKREKVGIMNLVPYGWVLAEIKLMKALSWLPQPLTYALIDLFCSPIIAFRELKKRLMR